MKFRSIRFPGSDHWRIQLSDRPLFRTDTIASVVSGEDAICLRQTFDNKDDAERAIDSLLSCDGLETGEWR